METICLQHHICHLSNQCHNIWFKQKMFALRLFYCVYKTRQEKKLSIIVIYQNGLLTIEYFQQIYYNLFSRPYIKQGDMFYKMPTKKTVLIMFPNKRLPQSKLLRSDDNHPSFSFCQLRSGLSWTFGMENYLSIENVSNRLGCQDVINHNKKL